MILNVQNLINIFIFLYIALSQFYFNPAGHLQFSHIVFAIFSFFILFFSIKKKTNFFFINYFIPLSLFIIYSFFVNLYYFLLYEEVNFLIASFHFFVGLYVTLNIVLYLFHVNSVKFFQFSLYTSLSLLFFFYIFQIGEYEFYPRYNAFFYGPAQMAHWALCIFSCYGLLTKKILSKKEKTIFVIFFIITLSIILASGTRSAYLSILFMLIVTILVLLNKNKKIENSFIFISFLVILIVISIINIDILQATYDRFQSINLDGQLKARGYNRIYDNYEYILFGAGQALDERFYLVSRIYDGVYTELTFEIHSTFAAILFYYGIFGFILFVFFLFKIFTNLELEQKLFFLIPFCYSLTTYNARTPIFWFFIGVSIFVSMKNFKNKQQFL